MINIPIKNDKNEVVKIDNKFEIPDNFIELSSLFFKNFTKKKMPENKNIKTELSINVFNVLTLAKIDMFKSKLSICFSLKKNNSSTKLVSNKTDKKTHETINKHFINSIDKYFIKVWGK